jgi:hypothetical protein
MKNGEWRTRLRFESIVYAGAGIADPLGRALDTGVGRYYLPSPNQGICERDSVFKAVIHRIYIKYI